MNPNAWSGVDRGYSGIRHAIELLELQLLCERDPERRRLLTLSRRVLERELNRPPEDV